MQPAWVTVIIQPITLDMPLMLQDITKVITVVQTSIMTIKTATTTDTVDVAGVEADTVVAATGMVHTKPSHSNFHNSLVQVIKRLGQSVKQDRFPPDPRLTLLPLGTLTSLVVKYALKNRRPRRLSRMRMQFRNLIVLPQTLTKMLLLIASKRILQRRLKKAMR
jgi:hypothetical protein